MPGQCINLQYCSRWPVRDVRGQTHRSECATHCTGPATPDV